MCVYRNGDGNLKRGKGRDRKRVPSPVKTWHHPKHVVSLKLTAGSGMLLPLESLNKKYSLRNCTSFIIITFIYHRQFH